MWNYKIAFNLLKLKVSSGRNKGSNPFYVPIRVKCDLLHLIGSNFLSYSGLEKMEITKTVWPPFKHFTSLCVFSELFCLISWIEGSWDTNFIVLAKG